MNQFCRLRYFTTALLKKAHGGVYFRETKHTEHMIYPSEEFSLPECRDVEGKVHPCFEAYKAFIPSFYVNSLKNGMCYTPAEEVYTAEGQVILDHNPQKTLPPVRWRKFLKKIIYIDGKVVHLGLAGLENNYYHWLIDCLGRFYLLKRSGITPDFYVIANEMNFQKQWLSLLGIKGEQIISIHSNMFLRAKELIVPTLINNWDSIYFRGYIGYQRRWLPSWIINLYKENIIPGTKKQKKTRIYISRKKAPYRKILNEDDLMPILDRYGFTVFDLEDLTVKQQIEAFVNAQAVVGLHGAGLVNAIFSEKGTPVLEINTQYYHDSSYRVLFVQTGHPYFYIVGETDDLLCSTKKENVYIKPEKFEGAIKVLLEHIQ